VQAAFFLLFLKSGINIFKELKKEIEASKKE
jgi:hypothetical protein